MPQDKPNPISFNLDTLEQESRPTPFVAVFNGDRYEFIDAMDIDWQDLIRITQDPTLFFTYGLPREQSEKLLGQKLPAWKMQELTKAYLGHYGVTSFPEAAASL